MGVSSFELYNSIAEKRQVTTYLVLNQKIFTADSAKRARFFINFELRDPNLVAIAH